MFIKQINYFFVIIFLTILSLGMSPRVDSNANAQLQDIVSRSIAEQAFQDIESVYAAKDLTGLRVLLDNDFDSKTNFGYLVGKYFLLVEKVHIHFVIDMITSYKDRLSVRAHWFKKVLTPSGELVSLQGSCVINFKKGPEGLKISGIIRDNPFY